MYTLMDPYDLNKHSEKNSHFWYLKTFMVQCHVRIDFHQVVGEYTGGGGRAASINSV